MLSAMPVFLYHDDNASARKHQLNAFFHKSCLGPAVSSKHKIVTKTHIQLPSITEGHQQEHGGRNWSKIMEKCSLLE